MILPFEPKPLIIKSHFRNGMGRFQFKHKLILLSTQLLLALLFFICPSHYSQKIVNYGEKKYVVYCSLEEANKVHPDSVYGLQLYSNGFKNFPKEIFKFKNLKYLEVGNSLWVQVLDSLTPKKRKKYYKLKRETCDRCEVMRYYKPNIIRSIPKEIKSLKKLEHCNFVTADIRSWRRYVKIFEYLPNAYILPPKEGF